MRDRRRLRHRREGPGAARPGRLLRDPPVGHAAVPRAPTSCATATCSSRRAARRSPVPSRPGPAATARAAPALRARRLGASLRPRAGGMSRDADHRRARSKGRRLKAPEGHRHAADGRARAADPVRHPGPAHPGLPVPRRLRRQRRRRPRGPLARRGPGGARGLERARPCAAMRENAGGARRAGRRACRSSARTRASALAALADSRRPLRRRLPRPALRQRPLRAAPRAAGRGRLLDAEGVVVAEHFHKRALPETIGGLVRDRARSAIGDHV